MDLKYQIHLGASCISWCWWSWDCCQGTVIRHSAITSCCLTNNKMKAPYGTVTWVIIFLGMRQTHQFNLHSLTRVFLTGFSDRLAGLEADVLQQIWMTPYERNSKRTNQRLVANFFFFFNTLNREVEAGCVGELVGRSAFVRGPCPE